MRIITYILFFLFSLSIVGKSNLIAFIKKIKTPVELASTEVDDEAKSLDDEEGKERSEKEESKQKDSYYLKTSFYYGIALQYNCNKHTLDFYALLFKSHFKEVVTPPPELV
ncbi:hypothetical protein [Cytophaga aurantiaca]|uniref:hypothetical protein n=1 Tax=Cytophaga aurantiaca TaxID=29530 RepID=UPI00036982E3|nr:hypothetical protein [Cytophaga aurantiaca]